MTSEIPVPPNHPANASPERVTCPECHKTIAVRKNGTYWRHRSDSYAWASAYRKAVCPNSGRPVEGGVR